MSLIDSKKSRYKMKVAIAIALTCIIVFPMLSVAAGYVTTGEVETARFSRGLSHYSGAFSTAVSVSVNPFATIAVLSIFGSIENAALYSDSVVLNSIADFLNGIPIIREMGKMPVANPYAATVFSIVAIGLCVVNSTKIGSAIYHKMPYFSQEKLDRIASNLCFIAISLLRFVTNDELASNPPGVKAGQLAVKAVSILGKTKESSQIGVGDYLLTAVTSIAVIIFGNCIFSCINNGETIVAAVPVKGTSLIGQIVKAFFHMILMLLQMFAPIVSVIVGIHLAVISVFLFKTLKRIAQYYSDIYILTTLRRIFWRKRAVPRIEKRVPRRLKKLYPNMEIGMSVYTFHGYARLAKRSRVWLIKEGDKVDLVYKRLIRKPYIISWTDLRERHSNKTVYLEQCLRFLRIRTEDKKIELVMSNRYKPEAEMLSELLGLNDYAIVKQENKETKKLNRKLRKERRKKKNSTAPV